METERSSSERVGDATSRNEAVAGAVRSTCARTTWTWRRIFYGAIDMEMERLMNWCAEAGKVDGGWLTRAEILIFSCLFVRDLIRSSGMT